MRRVGLGRESPTALGGKGVLASKVSLHWESQKALLSCLSRCISLGTAGEEERAGRLGALARVAGPLAPLLSLKLYMD